MSVISNPRISEDSPMFSIFLTGLKAFRHRDIDRGPNLIWHNQDVLMPIAVREGLKRRGCRDNSFDPVSGNGSFNCYF